MKSANETSHTASSKPDNPSKMNKKSVWQKGLNPEDLDVLRRNLTAVELAKPAGGEDRPRPIQVGPVEFAQLAAILAQQYGRETPPQRYFRAADELIRLADHYLSNDRQEKHGKRIAALELDLNAGYVAIDVALRSFAKPTDKGSDEKRTGKVRKKDATQLGNISTRNGLIKALKRLFGNEYESKIVRRTFRIDGKDVEVDALDQGTISQILEDQKDANFRRGLRAMAGGGARSIETSDSEEG